MDLAPASAEAVVVKPRVVLGASVPLVTLTCPSCGTRLGPVKREDLTAKNARNEQKLLWIGCPRENRPHAPHRFTAPQREDIDRQVRDVLSAREVSRG